MGEFFDNPGAFDRWVTLWKLKVPPKWRTFLQRAICDILPTTNNLIVKRVQVDPTCPMCGQAHEDVMHALILCDYSKMVWNISGLHVTNILTNFFSSWLVGVLNILTEDQTRLAVGVLYYLWKARNSVVWEKALPRSGWTVTAAARAERTYIEVNRSLRQASSTVTPVDETHHRPRCYLDAGYKQPTREATYGVVLLSHDGSFIAAKSGNLPSAFSPLMAEALACKEALSWLKDRNILTFVLVTDCMELRNMLHSSRMATLSYVGVIVDQCRTSMSLFTCLHQTAIKENPAELGQQFGEARRSTAIRDYLVRRIREAQPYAVRRSSEKHSHPRLLGEENQRSTAVRSSEKLGEAQPSPTTW
ncbi:PREDICTED: uncharacterized protein LOC109148594 [Ipomoea nil]|uniref:uncharacterized protein LOC109148594 n=1 Tax=Ipomoea nil TaxID=35883 RepID=UPI000901986E|nr:PREDICTED: uncharacterized protein LOC109148594 [Ipomoea nil]